MSGPLGAAMTFATKGWSATVELFALSLRVPGRASVALLQGVYGLRAEGAARARRAGTIAALAIALVSGVVVTTVLLVLAS